MKVCETCGATLRERKKGESWSRWEALRFCSAACKGQARAVTWTLAEVMERVAVTESDCWLWTGSISRGGYARLCHLRRSYDAHRFIYGQLVGPIPSGMQLDHACHSADLTCAGGDDCPHRRCVNPAHLEPVTPSENAQRSRSVSRTHCLNGHPLTASNTYTPPEGGRRCRTCMSDRQRAYRLRLREAG